MVVGDPVGALLNPLLIAPLLVLGSVAFSLLGSVPLDEVAKRCGLAWVAAAAMLLWAPNDGGMCVALRQGDVAPSISRGASSPYLQGAVERALGTPTEALRPTLEIPATPPDQSACQNLVGTDMLGTTGTLAYVHRLRDYPAPGTDYRLTFDLTPFVIAGALVAGIYLLRGPRAVGK
jgi:hypothetical protein